MGAALAIIVESVGVAEVVDQIDLEQHYVAGITERYNRIYRDVVAIGGLLVEARRQLQHGAFLRMLRTHLPFSQRTAYNYMEEWHIATDPNLQPVANMTESYSIRSQINRLRENFPKAYDAAVVDGRLSSGVARSEVVEIYAAAAKEYVHAPDIELSPPSRPEGSGATNYSEMVYLLVEWRKARGVSQAALDDLVGWAEGYASKVEIPHDKANGKRLTFLPNAESARGSAWDLLQGLGLCLKLEPVG